MTPLTIFLFFLQFLRWWRGLWIKYWCIRIAHGRSSSLWHKRIIVSHRPAAEPRWILIVIIDVVWSNQCENVIEIKEKKFVDLFMRAKDERKSSIFKPIAKHHTHNHHNYRVKIISKQINSWSECHGLQTQIRTLFNVWLRW